MVWPFSKSDPSSYLPQAETQAKKEDPPAYVDQATFNRALDDVRSIGSKLDQFLGGQQQPQQTTQPVVEAPIDDISDEDYADALLRGDAARITRRNKAEVERASRAIKHDYDQRFARLEGQGMAILDQVNTEVGQQAMGGMPYYGLLKNEVDTQLKALQPHQRTPEMREWIYQRTVGANLEKIKAHDQAEEARIRQERQTVTTPGRDREGRDATPTAASVFGEDMMSPNATVKGGGQLWRRHTPDEWARNRYGTKDANEAAVMATNVLALSDCPQCFGPVIGGKCHCRGNR